MAQLTEKQIETLINLLNYEIEETKESRDDTEYNYHWRQFCASVVDEFEDCKTTLIKMKEELR